MKLVIPFTYLKPTRRPEGTELPIAVPAVWLSRLTVDVPEIDAATAPVVATWTRREVSIDGRETTFGHGICRHDGTDFYVPAAMTGDEETRPADVDGSFVRQAGQEKPWFSGLADYLVCGATEFGSQLWHALPRRRAMAVMDGFEKGVSDDVVAFSASVSEARRYPALSANTEMADLGAATVRAGKLVVIDGFLWRRVFEPKLQLAVSTRYGEYRGFVDVAFGDGIEDERRGWKPGPLEMLYFPLGGMESLKATMPKLSFPLDPRTTIEDVSILDPAVFRFDSWANNAMRTMVEAIGKYEPSVGGMDAVLASTFVELRDEVARLGSGSSTEDVEYAVRCHFDEFLARVPEDDLYVRTVTTIELFEAPPEDADDNPEPADGV